jgi:hypothetical protein
MLLDAYVVTLDGNETRFWKYSGSPRDIR